MLDSVLLPPLSVLSLGAYRTFRLFRGPRRKLVLAGGLRALVHGRYYFIVKCPEIGPLPTTHSAGRVFGTGNQDWLLIYVAPTIITIAIFFLHRWPQCTVVEVNTPTRARFCITCNQFFGSLSFSASFPSVFSSCNGTCLRRSKPYHGVPHKSRSLPHHSPRITMIHLMKQERSTMVRYPFDCVDCRAVESQNA